MKGRTVTLKDRFELCELLSQLREDECALSNAISQLQYALKQNYWNISELEGLQDIIRAHARKLEKYPRLKGKQALPHKGKQCL